MAKRGAPSWLRRMVREAPWRGQEHGWSERLRMIGHRGGHGIGPNTPPSKGRKHGAKAGRRKGGGRGGRHG